MRAPPTQRRTTRIARTHVIEAFGLSIASEYPFRFHHARGQGRPDITFEVVDTPPLPAGWEATPPSFDAYDPATPSDMLGTVVFVDECVVVRFLDTADFFLWNDRITCVLYDPTMEHGIEIWLFGTVLSLWLELRGIPTLHAATVIVHGHAIGFLATNKGGKSTLAMTMVQGGASLLADDQLPLERSHGRVVGRASYPQMRFWPDQAERLFGTTDGLQRVQPGSTKLRVPVGRGGFGAFERRAVPVGALYLPERDASDQVEIVRVHFAEAVTELVRHSFLAGVLDAMGSAPQRFHVFADVLRQAPLRRLRYPSGLEHLGDVRDAILADLAGLEPPAAEPRLRRRGP
jgi:hypothetical protein